MYFSYNGTRDWLKIEWRDQSCMMFEVVAKNKHTKNAVKHRIFSLGSKEAFCRYSMNI